jgi:hypothetical protein
VNLRRNYSFQKQETKETDLKSDRHKTHLGCGDPLIGFWPYFLQEYSSGGISAIFGLIAGTLVTLFTLDFLLIQIKSKWNQFQKSTHPVSENRRRQKFYNDEPTFSWNSGIARKTRHT